MNKKCPECGENCCNCVGLNLEWFEEDGVDNQPEKSETDECSVKNNKTLIL